MPDFRNSLAGISRLFGSSVIFGKLSADDYLDRSLRLGSASLLPDRSGNVHEINSNGNLAFSFSQANGRVEKTVPCTGRI